MQKVFNIVMIGVCVFLVVVFLLVLTEDEPTLISYTEYEKMRAGSERERNMALAMMLYAINDADVARQCDEYNQPFALTKQNGMYFEVNCIDRWRYLTMAE